MITQQFNIPLYSIQCGSLYISTGEAVQGHIICQTSSLPYMYLLMNFQAKESRDKLPEGCGRVALYVYRPGCAHAIPVRHYHHVSHYFHYLYGFGLGKVVLKESCWLR